MVIGGATRTRILRIRRILAGGEAPLPIRAAARLPKIAPVGRLRFRSSVSTRILRIRRISADWLMEGGNGVSAANVITLKAGETPALPFTRNALDKRFAAEASKNLENAESNSDLLDRGCVSRRRIFYHKEHKETIAYRFV